MFLFNLFFCLNINMFFFQVIFLDHFYYLSTSPQININDSIVTM